MSQATAELGPRHRYMAMAAMWITVALMVVGIAISIYMTWHHEMELYGGTRVEVWGCADAEGVDCGLVNTSEWSELLGVPLFTLAIPTYVMVGVCAALVALGRRRYLVPILVTGIGASLFSIFLWYLSVNELGAVCLWCKRLYYINFATVALALVAGAYKPPLPTLRELGIAAGTLAVAALVAIGAQRAYRASIFGEAGAIDLEARSSSQEGAAAAMAGGVDPKGKLAGRTIDVVTEDKNKARLVVSPTDAWKGNPNARVAVVEFADLQCGYCKRAASQLRRLYDAYKDDVLFVFKHFPMDNRCNSGVKNRRHVYACDAGEAAVCAQAQGRFWAFHDLAFKNQHQLRKENLLVYGEAVGLDMDALKTCLQRNQGATKVEADAAAGAALDIHGTPRIFIDGTLYRAGTSAERMAEAIERALGANAADARTAAARVREADADAPIRPIPAEVPEMTEVTVGDLHFWMDTFESGIADGRAFTGKHVIPATRMSWFAAKDACQAAGKRMCSEREWVATCQNAPPVDDDGNGQYADDMVEGTTYVYSDFHDPRRCWADRNPTTERPVYTGEMPGCVGPLGVYDLVGNVEEWVGTTPDNATLLGGAFDTDEDHARCYRRNDTFGAGFANDRTGFRCCADQPPQPD